jgi:hypothetical protein
MTNEEYKQQPFVQPYTFNIKTSKGELLYFGSSHFNDPEDEMYPLVLEAFNDFRPDALVVEQEPEFSYWIPESLREARLKSLLVSSRRDAVLKGESQLGLRLAAENNLYAECAAPAMSDTCIYLQSAGFSGEEVGAYYLLRAASNFRFHSGQFSFDELIEFRKKQLQEGWIWSEAALTWESAIEIGRSIWGEFDPTDADRQSVRLMPVLLESSPEYSIMNSIAHHCTKSVDISVVSRILEVSNRFRKVFVIYGTSHAMVQERSLWKLLDEGRGTGT